MLRNNKNPDQNTEDMDESESNFDSMNLLATFDKSVNDEFTNDEDIDDGTHDVVKPNKLNEIFKEDVLGLLAENDSRGCCHSKSECARRYIYQSRYLKKI